VIEINEKGKDSENYVYKFEEKNYDIKDYIIEKNTKKIDKFNSSKKFYRSEIAINKGDKLQRRMTSKKKILLDEDYEFYIENLITNPPKFKFLNESSKNILLNINIFNENHILTKNQEISNYDTLNKNKKISYIIKFTEGNLT
jgi:hypothetical protein